MQNQNDSTSEKVAFYLQAAAHLVGLIFAPFRRLPFTGTLHDLSVPGVSFILTLAFFLLSINYFPLFEHPTPGISIGDAIDGSYIYLREHSINALFAQSWTILSFFTLSWIIIIFLVHSRIKEHQQAMLGVTLTIFTVILIYIQIKFFVGLFLIKGEYSKGWRLARFINELSVKGIPVVEFFYAIPLLKIFTAAWSAFTFSRYRGLVTLALFAVLMWLTYGVFAEYIGKKIYRKNLVTYNTAHVGGIKSTSIPTDTVLKTLVVTPLEKQVQIGAPDSNKPISLHMSYRRFYYKTAIDIRVSNRSDTGISLPYHKSLRLNLIADSILLRKQGRFVEKDFIFKIVKIFGNRELQLKIPPQSTKKIRIEGHISHLTYDYLLRYMRENPSALYKAKFYIPMENGRKTLDVITSSPMAVTFANSEIYGQQEF